MLNALTVNKILGGQLLAMQKPPVSDCYSQAFKRKVLNCVKDTGSSREASRVFDLQRTMIDRWVREDNRY